MSGVLNLAILLCCTYYDLLSGRFPFATFLVLLRAGGSVVEIPEGEAMHVDARVTVSVVAPTIVPCVPKHEFLLVVVSFY